MYGGQPKPNGAEFSGFVGDDGIKDLNGSLAYTYGYTSGQVGTYADCVRVGGLSSDNYEIVYKSGSLEILPLPVDLKWAGAENLVYDGKAHYVTAVAANAIEGDDLSVSVKGGEAVNAGNYTAVAVLSGTDSENYLLSEKCKLGFCVAKADIPLAVQINDTEYGEELSPRVTGNFGGGAVTFSYGDSPDRAGDLFRPKAGVHYVFARVGETLNYNSATAVSRFEVTPKEVALEWENDGELVYDSQAKNVYAVVSDVLYGDDVSVRVNGGNAVDAGAHTAEAELIGEDAYNYVLPQSRTCAYVIQKCALKIVAQNKTSVYSEQFQELTAEVFGNIYNGEVGYSLRKQDGVNAGIYAIEIIVGEFKNYEIETVPATYVIEKATPEIPTAVSGEFIVDGVVAFGTDLGELTERLPVASVSGEWSWKNGNGSVNKVGENSLKATFIPEDAKNYNEVEIEVTVFAKRANGFAVSLGSPNEVSQFAGCSAPYRLKWDGTIAVIDYIITLSWDGNAYGEVTVSAENADGTGLNVTANGDNLNVLIEAAGTYYLTFACAGNDEYMSESKTVTVVVE